MKRRDFLRMLLLVTAFGLFGRNIKAEKKSEDASRLKEAMFWRRLDDE